MARLTLRRPRFFYGWWIVLAAGVAAFVSSAFGGVVQSVVPRPMTEEFGWTRSEFTFANTAALILAAFSGLLVGPPEAHECRTRSTRR